MSNISVNTITDASGGSTASINGLTPQASNMQPFNRIINGAMTIDQRNAGAAVTPASGGYITVDRFSYYASQASKITIGQNLDSVTPPAGFRNYLGLKVAATATVGASDYFVVGQPIEGYNVADFNFGLATAATVTVSFWVRSSVTGTFGGYLKNGSSNRSYPFTYAISSANTWEQKTITVAGDTTGTWDTTNGQGLLLYFGLGVGSSLSFTPNAWGANNALGATGAASILATSGATFYITGVQLEAGSTASSFAHENYSDTLQKCQRYLPAFNFNGANQTCAVGIAYSTTASVMNLQHLVQTRVPPTGISVTGTFNSYNNSGNNAGNFSSITLGSSQGVYGSIINCTGGSGLVQGNATILLSPSSGTSQILLTGCEL